jgi:hypothetical protein
MIRFKESSVRKIAVYDETPLATTVNRFNLGLGISAHFISVVVPSKEDLLPSGSSGVASFRSLGTGISAARQTDKYDEDRTTPRYFTHRLPHHCGDFRSLSHKHPNPSSVHPHPLILRTVNHCYRKWSVWDLGLESGLAIIFFLSGPGSPTNRFAIRTTAHRKLHPHNYFDDNIAHTVFALGDIPIPTIALLKAQIRSPWTRLQHP